MQYIMYEYSIQKGQRIGILYTSTSILYSGVLVLVHDLKVKIMNLNLLN